MNVDLSTKDGFELACGMRGADVSTPLHSTHEQKVVKWVITARIRGLAGVGNMAGMVRRGPALTSQGWESYMTETPSLSSFLEGIRTLPYHYFTHAENAFAALIELSGQEDTREISILRDMASIAAAEVLNTKPLYNNTTLLKKYWTELFGGEGGD